MSEEKSTGAGKGDKDRSTYTKKYQDNFKLIDWSKKKKDNHSTES